GPHRARSADPRRLHRGPQAAALGPARVTPGPFQGGWTRPSMGVALRPARPSGNVARNSSRGLPMGGGDGRERTVGGGAMRKLGAAIFVTLFACACGGEPDLGRDAGRDGSTGQDGSSSVCAADSECDDGLYCNGVERCMPGADGAGANGCVAASSPCGPDEVCEEDADRCVPADCAEPDADGDGHDRIGCGAGDDCDDTDGDRYPGNFEVCDPEGHDEDCDPETISAQPDRDGDGYLDAACWNLRADGSENRGTDCDDTRNTVHPNAPE